MAKKILGVLLAITLLFVLLPFGNVALGDALTSTPAQTPDDAGIRLPSQHGAFYATGRYWIFYLDTSDDLSFKTSTDGETWSSATTVTSLPLGVGAVFDVVFDGTYVHYVRNTVFSLPNYKGIAYRRGTPQSDGSISWSAAEQTALANTETAFDVQLAIDSGGYVWIGYTNGAAGTYGYPTVTKSSTNDGTWSTASGFPYTFFSTDAWFVIPVPQTSGKVYCIVYLNYGSEDIIKGYPWNGSSWGSQEDATTSDLSNSSGSGTYGMLSVVNDGDDIHLVFMDASDDIQHVIRSSGAWGSETEVEGTLVAAYSSPVLTRRSDDDLICCWLHSDDKSYFKEYAGGSWGASATEFTDETVDGFTSERCLQAYYEESDDNPERFVLIYQTGSSPNYDIVHAIWVSVPTVDTQAGDEITSTSFDANGDITDDGGSTVTRRGFGYTTVYDDFEWGSDEDPLDDSGGPLTWTISVAGSSKAEIDEAVYHDGTRSGRLYRDGTNSPYAYFSQTALSSGQVLYYWFRKEDTANLVLYHGDNSKIINVYYQTDESIDYRDDGGFHDTGATVTAGDWALLCIDDVDWSGGTYDIYLDGILIQDDAVMRNAGGINNIVRFDIQAGTAQIWVDDVYVWDIEDESGMFSEGEYDLEISGLDPNTTYQVQAFAENSVGIGYGDIVSVLTAPAAPTNVSATDGDHTDKVVITWTKSDGADDYQVYRDGTPLGWIGDVATYDDTGADAPTITPGTASATDGDYTDKVTLTLIGETGNDGTTHTYKVRARNSEDSESPDSSTDTGYRGTTTLTYQWQRSAADSDADYSNITGATTDPYDDTAAPAPTITPGSTVATDGIHTDKVSLSLSGTSANNGDGRYYQCVVSMSGAVSQTSTSDRGYRSIGSLTYQWQRSSGDADEDYGDIVGATASTYNDEAAPAPTIIPGNADASDGTSTDYVTLTLTGHTGNDGDGRYWQCVLNADGAAQQISTSDRGYRGKDTLSYQWQRSAGDSDENYSNIDGATTNPYNDTDGVFQPDGRYYKCLVSMADAASQNSTPDRGYKLVVYAPNVTAISTTSITSTSASLTGNITNTGGENANTIGFEWGLSCGNYTWSWNTTGSFDIGTFTHRVSGLTGNTQYFWRAFAINGAGWGNSTCLNFTTLALPSAPTNFTITQIDGTTAYSLNWTIGDGADITIIRCKEAGYPTSITDGYLVYSGSGNSTILTNLNPDLYSYYYWAWSKNDYGYSLDHAETSLENPLGVPQVLFALGLLGFALWKRDWTRTLLSVCIIIWGTFAMQYDIKIAAPLLALGTILFIISIMKHIKVARGVQI